MVKIYISAYGCTASKDDADIIKGLVNKAGYGLTEDISMSDAIILVTCIVKSQTESKIRSKINEIITKYPKKKLIIAGCMPEAEYKICKEIAPKASLINTQHIKSIIKVIENKDGVVEFLGKRKENKLNLPKITKDKNIVNIQIAEGCISNCMFCVTKLAKGNLHSFPEEDITKEIKRRLKQNYKRFNITATDCSCYGIDINTNLVNLLRKITAIKADFRIRIGMMNPSGLINILDDLIETYKNGKIIKFIHIPVQSGSDKVLKEMNRNYKVRDFIKIVNKFRKEIPTINISTDIIVGYSTENEEDFKKTIDLIKRIKPEVLNISKFGARPGTKAAKLKPLKSQIVKERSVVLTKTFKEITNQKLNK